MTPSVSLGEPGDLHGFPATAPPSRLVRVCRASASTWRYSSDGTGRFDLGPALFGPAGTTTLDVSTRTPLTTSAMRAAGVDVYPPPAASTLTILT